MARTLLPGEPRDKLLALTREICALKLSESQLLASLAAANKRADSASVVNRTLQAALRAAEGKIDGFQVGGDGDCTR